MLLTQLLRNTDVKTIHYNDVEIDSIVTNSQKAGSGCLFIAIEGVKADGHDYAKEAEKKGAIAVVAMRPTGVSCTEIIVPDTRIALTEIYTNYYGNPAANLCISGVTGTNGKTTTAYLTQYILSRCGVKAGLIGTVENITGDGRESAKYTTPEPSQLQMLLKKMVDTGVTSVMMEVSSHALSQNRVHGIDYRVGAFTNLTRDHLDYHGSMENYLAEKLKLMDVSDVAVINIDDEYGQYFSERAKGEVITFGIEKDARLKAQSIVHRANGSYFTFSYDGEKYNTFIGIPGQFSVYNALCALGVCIGNGIPAEKAADALRSAPGVCGRMEIVPIDRDFTIIIDYAHTPDGLEKAITTLKEIPKEGKLTVLFGCGGDRDRTKRPMMGRIASTLADNIIVTSDNPRTEEPNKIILDILAGVAEDGASKTVIPDRKEAIRFAIESAKKGDVILLAGKGHETYQILKDMTIHFDEREVIHSVLAQQDV